MFHVACKQCRAWTVTEDSSSPDAALTCSCCPEQHDHAAAANACPGSHPPCPDTESCVFHGLEEGHPRTGDGALAGHCWTGYGTKPDGCTVCRPVAITGLRGSTTLRMAGRAS
jgi:hypothetical protein